MTHKRDRMEREREEKEEGGGMVEGKFAVLVFVAVR
jgi:hypothetical protein